MKKLWITTTILIIALALCFGLTACAKKNSTPHEHKFSTDWSTDDTNHWHSAICEHEEEKSDVEAHSYDNACDPACDVCGYTRTVGAHVYDNACDTKCNVCDAERTVGDHVYDNACDTKCNVCDAERTVGDHVYDNACDTSCNACGATRTITHEHGTTLTAGDTTHWYACSVCGDKKDETAHVFDKAVATDEYLKAEATATTKAQYYKSCVCGAKSSTEYFETDKTAGTLANVQNLSKTYDKVELANPTYETNSDGAVTIEWYQGDTKLDAKPVNAGTYKVKVIIAESATYTGISAEKEFTIAKVVVTIPTLEKEYDGYDEFEFVFEGPAGEEIDCLVEIGNKNAGTYTDVAITYKSVSSENYEITATTVSATITPKTLNYLELTKVYDGVGFIDYALGTEHGVVSGDVVVLTCDGEFDYEAGSYYFIDKTDDISLTDSGIDRAFLDGADAGNYQFANQVISGLDGYEMGGMLTVTKRPVWAENVAFPYDGYDTFCGDEYPVFTLQNVVSGETIHTGDVSWYFDSKNVGATLTAVELIEEYYPNYTLDFSKCSASIVKRPVWAENVKFTYDGENSFYGDYATSEIVFQNVVTGETINACDIVFKFDNKDVGSGLIAVGYDDGITGNYEFDLSKCSADIVKRLVWAENVKFTYDGYTNWTGEESPNQIVFQNMANGESMDSSFVEWTFDSKNVGATLTSVAFVDEDDGRSNYEIDFSKCTASVIPRVIDNLTYAFEYNGMEYQSVTFQGDDIPGIIEHDSLFLEVCFATPNVGAALDTSEETGFEPGFLEENYVLGENYSFSIVPKKLTLKAGEKIEVTETYNTLKQYAISVSSDMFDGYVDTEAATLWLTATLPSKNAGKYTDGVILTPYVGISAFGTVSHNYDFSEVEATVTVNPLSVSLSSYVKVEYNGTCEFTLDTPFDLTSANTGGGQDSVSDNDEVYITWIETSSADITDETFAIDYTLGGADACNYEIDELGLEITKKKLTKLNIKITAATADSLVVTLLPKDGVIPGEVVKIKLPGLDTNQDFYNYTEIEMLIDEAAVRQGQEYVTLLKEGDYANYELATYDNNGVQMVGIISCVDECDVQYDGTCNCGTSHLIGTAKSSDIRTTLPCATTWTGGVYKISTLAGYWSILPSENFADITAIYDSKGNEVEIDANDAGFYAEAGTYYVHIGKAFDLGSEQHIQFTYTNTLANLGDSSAKSDLITAVSGDAIFFRIESDAPWGASMNVYSDNETTILESSKYTVKVYDEYFKELTDVIYDGTDVYHTTDDNYTVTDKTIYIEVTLKADTNVQLYIY